MTTPFADLNWPQRLQIITALDVDVSKAATTMDVSEQYIEQARLDYVPDATFNVEPYAQLFVEETDVPVIDTPPVKQKRRGRKTNKIQEAFNNVTTEKQELSSFCAKYGVSIHCIRQHTRFAPDRPDIIIRKDRELGQQFIWSTPIVTA